MTYTSDDFAYDASEHAATQVSRAHDLTASDREAMHAAAHPHAPYAVVDYVIAALFFACIVGALILGTEHFWGPYLGWRP